MHFLFRLFDPTGFPTRWRCGAGWSQSPELGWLHILSDLAVWAAYLAIPIVLAYFVQRRSDIPFRKIFVLFVAFILACGTTHLMEAIIFYWPVYRLAGAIKFATAVVSWTTVFALVQVVPQVLAMRSPEELQREITARQAVEVELQRINAELEQRVNDRTREVTQTAVTLREERELLAITLKSIGDGVIVTDAVGNVTFLNPVAEKLTEWSADDARGKPLKDVFVIVNETTRKPVENPAIRCLREGLIVGLANHTILIGRQGRELSIDDSAAPICTSDGALRGAVLVFRDISARKEAEAAVEQSQQQERQRALELETVLRATPTPIWISHDRDCRYVTGNPASYRLLHVPEGKNVSATSGEYVARTFRELRHGQPIAGSDLPLQQAARLGTDVVGAELTIVFDDNGETRHLYGNASPIYDDQNKVCGAVAAFMDITEIKQAAQRTDEFLATLAHELRNPLAPIRNALEMLKLVQDDHAIRQHAQETMERQVNQLVRLVDDLIDMSRISRNKLKLREELVTLELIVQAAVETCRPLAEASGQKILVELATPSSFQFVADPARLSQVLSNLLTNACKYSHAEQRIWLRSRQEAFQLVLEVQDEGLGIPTDKLGAIFEMFTQLDHGPERLQSGLGIGLTLVKRLVELHGGTIEAQSAGEGRGSRFIVRLPVGEQVSGRNAIVTPVRSQVATAPSRRILVVDDNHDSALTLSMLLRISGHEVQTAHDGEEGLAAAEKWRPDVLLLDIGMPKLDGYDVCRTIRQRDWGSQVVIVALTGWGQSEDRRRSSEAGFDAHLVKPVDPQQLAEVLKPRRPGPDLDR